MVSKAGNNPTQALNGASSLAEIKDDGLRFQMAAKGLVSLGGEIDQIVSGFNDLALKSGSSKEVTTICEQFQGMQENLRELNTQALGILKEGMESGNKLDSGKGADLEKLNQKANKIKENMMELLKQLYFRRKDDDDQPGGAAAPPMLLVSAQA